MFRFYNSKKKPGGLKILRRVIVNKCRVSTSRQNIFTIDLLPDKTPEKKSK